MNDAFRHLAPYYDVLMAHVDYDRWALTSAALAGCLPSPMLHLDAGCGTGALLAKMRQYGYRSAGVDLSPAMARVARAEARAPVAVADLQALPFHRSALLVTCLFDSINFLLEEAAMRRALESLAACLKPGGLLYFDMVTERMVLEHFAGQSWREEHTGFRSRWHCTYDAKRAIASTEITIKRGQSGIIRERVYTREQMARALEAAGLEVLAEVDAETWRKPARATLRVDYIAGKSISQETRRGVRNAVPHVRALLRQGATQ